MTDIRPLHVVEREAILRAIAHCGGSMREAAKLLEIGHSTVWRKFDSYRRQLPLEARRAGVSTHELAVLMGEMTQKELAQTERYSRATAHRRVREARAMLGL